MATKPPSSDESDKLDALIKRWQKETRDEIKAKGDTEFDFLSARSPHGLVDRVKDQTRIFIEDSWLLQSHFSRAKTIAKQFMVHSNPFNELLKE